MLTERFGNNTNTNGKGYGIQVVAGNADTRGTPVSLGTTSFHWSGFYLTVHQHHFSVDHSHLISLEDANGDDIIRNVVVTNRQSRGPISMWVPKAVPKGTEIFAVNQGEVGGGYSSYVDVVGYNSPILPSFNLVRTFGVDEANTNGTEVAHQGTADTKTNWANLLTAANNDFNCKAFQVRVTPDSDSTGRSITGLYDVWLDDDDTGNPTVKALTEISFRASDNQDIHGPCFWPRPVEAGTRFAFRFMSTSTSGDVEVGLYLYA